MDPKYLLNCQHSLYKVGFFTIEDAINHVESFKKDCRKRKIYCEEQYEIGVKAIIVTLNVWE